MSRAPGLAQTSIDGPEVVPDARVGSCRGEVVHDNVSFTWTPSCASLGDRGHALRCYVVVVSVPSASRPPRGHQVDRAHRSLVRSAAHSARTRSASVPRARRLLRLPLVSATCPALQDWARSLGTHGGGHDPGGLVDATSINTTLPLAIFSNGSLTLLSNAPAPTVFEKGDSLHHAPNMAAHCRPAGERPHARFNGASPMHIVLRFYARARGAWSLRRRRTEVGIRVVLRALARRHGVRVYEFAVTSNHLHAVLRAKTRAQFQAFLRAFAGVVARLATGARRGHPVGRFWDDLAYSRVLHWGREFRKCGTTSFRMRWRRSASSPTDCAPRRGDPATQPRACFIEYDLPGVPPRRRGRPAAAAPEPDSRLHLGHRAPCTPSSAGARNPTSPAPESAPHRAPSTRRPERLPARHVRRSVSLWPRTCAPVRSPRRSARASSLSHHTELRPSHAVSGAPTNHWPSAAQSPRTLRWTARSSRVRIPERLPARRGTWAVLRQARRGSCRAPRRTRAHRPPKPRSGGGRAAPPRACDRCPPHRRARQSSAAATPSRLRCSRRPPRPPHPPSCSHPAQHHALAAVLRPPLPSPSAEPLARAPGASSPRHAPP